MKPRTPSLRGLTTPWRHEQAHDPGYVERFCNGALDDAALKRIGFGAVARSPVLVERTLAEIAGGCTFRTVSRVMLPRLCPAGFRMVMKDIHVFKVRLFALEQLQKTCKCRQKFQRNNQQLSLEILVQECLTLSLSLYRNAPDGGTGAAAWSGGEHSWRHASCT